MIRSAAGFVLSFLFAATAGTPAAAPRNIILIIGDGTGPAHYTAARQVVGATWNIGRLKTIGLCTTMAADRYVTDSAAAASALATGEKTKYEALSVDDQGNPRRTVLEAAKALGKSTGLVTTAQFYDATPAAFASHAPSRRDYAGIVPQILKTGPDVVVGAGWEIFGKDKMAPLPEYASAAGYTLITSAAGLDAAPATHALVAFPSTDNDLDQPDVPLSRLAGWALDRLSRNPKGFFLLIEHEGTDSSSHSNAAADVQKSLKSLDAAVGVALDFAAKHGDTLVIVTGDHETGGLRLTESHSGKFRMEWSTIEHTATAVPVFSTGPGSERLTGFFDNTDVGKLLLSFEAGQ